MPPEAAYAGYDRHYLWENAGLNWSEGLTRTLTLSEPASNRARSAVSVESASEPTGPGKDTVYAKDDRIEVRVRFSAPVVVDTSEGAPTLGLALGGVRREAAWVHATGAAAELAFALTVGEADAGAGGGEGDCQRHQAERRGHPRHHRDGRGARLWRGAGGGVGGGRADARRATGHGARARRWR